MPPKWVFGICCLATVITIAVVILHKDATISTQVLNVPGLMITGVFGAAYGHALGSSQASKTATTVNAGEGATINSGDNAPKS